MINYHENLKPMERMLVRIGADPARCWNSNETLFCLAAKICLECLQRETCDSMPIAFCPNIRMFENLKSRLVH